MKSVKALIGSSSETRVNQSNRTILGFERRLPPPQGPTFLATPSVWRAPHRRRRARETHTLCKRGQSGRALRGSLPSPNRRRLFSFFPWSLCTVICVAQVGLSLIAVDLIR
ncbi:unnamed protein product [Caenorhabditis auriculariae]|uniref:Uncharacterized protein n=1 Tax=Caenorhabditis auriculariae TaxID=2777116 RepID=A0A8S1H8U7_9PELO|nr:unnamed protein product [Caenorhabditis auriculariae]